MLRMGLRDTEPGSQTNRLASPRTVGETSNNAHLRTLERTAIEVDCLLSIDAPARRPPRAARTFGSIALRRPTQYRTADVRVAARTPGVARGRHERPERVS